MNNAKKNVIYETVIYGASDDLLIIEANGKFLDELPIDCYKKNYIVVAEEDVNFMAVTLEYDNEGYWSISYSNAPKDWKIDLKQSSDPDRMDNDVLTIKSKTPLYVYLRKNK